MEGTRAFIEKRKPYWVPQWVALKKILIANRGEIACRIARTAHAMAKRCDAGIPRVHGDKLSPHAKVQLLFTSKGHP